MRFTLTSTTCCWIFVSASHENRHLWDIVFGVEVLKRRGIPLSSVHVFTDHPAPDPVLRPYGISQLRPLNELQAGAAGILGFDACVMVVTGHGAPYGIGGPSDPLSPCAMLSIVRSVPNVQVGVLVLGQCFAGVLNYTDASTTPPLVLLGATNLSPSLSGPVTLNQPIVPSGGGSSLTSWSANLFLFHFFDWLSAPRDVDGDGRVTLADAYRHAGATANSSVVTSKCSLFIGASTLAARFTELQEEVDLLGAKAPKDLQLRRDSVGKKLEQFLQMLYNHQEIWLLNANLAREVAFG